MFNKVLACVFMTLSGSAQGYAMEYMIENKKSSIKTRMLFWLLLSLVCSAINIFGGNLQRTHTLRAIIHWSTILFVLFYFYKDPLWRKAFAYVLIFFAYSMSELSLAFSFYIQKVDITILTDRTQAAALINVIVASVLSCSSCIIVVSLWRRFFHKGRKMKYVWFLILYSLNYFLSVFTMANSIYDSNLTANEVLTVIIGGGCMLIVLIIVFSQVEKQWMETSLAESRYKAELEQIHFHEVEKRREKVAEILKENRNIMIQICDNLKRNNNVETILENLLEKMSETKEYPFCDIPAINALLSEKKKECDEKQIKLETDIRIPEERRVSSMELCRIFGNLMDNAMKANEMVTDKLIVLTAVIHQGYLVIKCENPFVERINIKSERVGYGLKIMREIAELYQGELHTEQDNNKFKTQLILKI